MAKATVSPAVTTTAVVEVTPAKVTLELSNLEAATLQAILAKVGGDPTIGYRVHAEDISSALSKAGYRFTQGLTQEVYRTTSRNGSITFMDKTHDNGYFAGDGFLSSGW